MRYPGPIKIGLNLCFERPAIKSPRPLTSEDAEGLKEFYKGLHYVTRNTTPSDYSSALGDTDGFVVKDGPTVCIFGTENTDSEETSSPAFLEDNKQPKSDELNPRAAPFVPILTPRSALRLFHNTTINELHPPSLQLSPPTSRSLQPSQLLRPDALPHIAPTPARALPPWLQTVRLATCAAGAWDHQRHTLDIIASHVHWAPDDLAELARYFCSKGCGCADSQELEGIAVFASALYWGFYGQCGLDTCQLFTHYLEQYLLEALRTRWDSDSLESVAYRYGSMEYLATSHNLVSFIGDLFRCGAISGGPAVICIATLLKNIRIRDDLNSVEHLKAIRLLILHAGTDLWNGTRDNAPIYMAEIFTITFKTSLGVLLDNVGSNGNPLPEGWLDVLIKQVEGAIAAWRPS